MTAVRRRLLGVFLTLSLLALLAPLALASTWGGAAKTGRWSGKDRSGDRVSFRINHRGFGLARLRINAVYSCETIPDDGGPNIPAGGGRIKAGTNKVAALDDFGETQFTIKAPAPGASHPAQIQFSMGFTAHHPIPPGAKTGTGEVGGFFAKDNGDQCTIGGGGDLHAHPG
jgi:hypothetical protein